MPVSLTTFASGASIDASVMYAKLKQTELYINEGIVAGDRSAGWLQANHVYRPDFYGGSNPHTTLTSGEGYFRSRPSDETKRQFFSWYLGAGPYPIPGLALTLQLPETLSQGTTYYRMFIAASFYVYEYGGGDGNMDEALNRAAYVALAVNGTVRPSLVSQYEARDIYKGSQTETREVSAFYPRKQVSFVAGIAGLTSSLRVGCNDIAVVVSPIASTFYNNADVPPKAIPDWKHIIIQQGNLVERHYFR